MSIPPSIVTSSSSSVNEPNEQNDSNQNASFPCTTIRNCCERLQSMFPPCNHQCMSSFAFANIATTGVGMLGGAAAASFGGFSLGSSIVIGAMIGGGVSIPFGTMIYACREGWNPCPNERNTVTGLLPPFNDLTEVIVHASPDFESSEDENEDE